MSYIISGDTCIYCGACAGNCPINAIHDANDSDHPHYRIDDDYCVGCGTCAPLCPVGAITAE